MQRDLPTNSPVCFCGVCATLWHEAINVLGMNTQGGTSVSNLCRSSFRDSCTRRAKSESRGRRSEREKTWRALAHMDIVKPSILVLAHSLPPADAPNAKHFKALQEEGGILSVSFCVCVCVKFHLEKFTSSRSPIFVRIGEGVAKHTNQLRLPIN